MSNPYIKQYQQSQVQTASPEKILIMLYDGAIQFLNKAKIAFESDDVEHIHNNLIGAQKIIEEFMNTLDTSSGEEVLFNLYNLYEYLHYRLVQANIRKDITMVDEVLNHLKELKATWEEAIKISQREQALNEGSNTEGNPIKTAWMNITFNKSKQIIKTILEKTSNIESFINEKAFDKSEILLKEKDSLLIEFNSIDKKEFSEKEKKEINSYISKIKEIENSYIKKIQSFLEETKTENKNITINKKLSKAYKLSVENNPRIIDTKE